MRRFKFSLLLIVGLLASISCRNDSPGGVALQTECQITYNGNMSPADFKGVRLSPDYQLAIQGKASSDYEEESAKVAADLYGRFHELPLAEMPDCVSEIYRLTWVPSFHRTTIVRVWSSTAGRFLTIKRLERTHENKNGTNYTETTRTLTDREWDSVVSVVKSSNFWNIASTEKEAVPNDGAGWLIEGSGQHQYHSVFRLSPDPDLVRLIRELFALSGENTEIDNYLPEDAK